MFAIDYPNKSHVPLEYLYTSPDRDKAFLSQSNIFNLTRVQTEKYLSIERVKERIRNVDYVFSGILIRSIPENLSYLIPTIEKSKSILLLEDDWDDEGSTKYDEYTWVESIKFLLDYASTLYQDFNIEIDIPKIYNGPRGSIDILWETSTYLFLININKNGEDAVFYADNNAKSHRIKGDFKLNHYNRALIPLAIQL